MKDKGYYLEVTITGKAKVWVHSSEDKSEDELEEMERSNLKEFYSKSEWDSDEIIEWDIEEITKIERSEEIDK